MQLKRKSGSNQSWNIQDEIRKVRAKATEEMLKSPSSVASLEPKYSPYVLATDMLKGNASSLNADGAVRNEQSRALPNSAIPTSEHNQVSSTLYTMCLSLPRKNLQFQSFLFWCPCVFYLSEDYGS
jgi:hypothetical protein